MDFNNMARMDVDQDLDLDEDLDINYDDEIEDSRIVSSSSMLHLDDSSTQHDEDMICSSTELSMANKKAKLCLVCGDKALGCNFNAVSCESCKAFFRRNAHKVIRGRCDGKCQVTVESRSFCKRCRLAKCFVVGMRRDMILNDEQKKQRKQKIITNKLRRHGQMSPETISTSGSPNDFLPPISDNHNFSGQAAPIPPSPVAIIGGQTNKINSDGSSLDLKQHQIKSEYSDSGYTSLNETKSSSDGSKSSESDSSSSVFTPWVDSKRQVTAAIECLSIEDRVVVREIRSAMELTSFLGMSTSSLKMVPTTPESFVNVAEKFVRKIIKMAKNISVFRNLQRQDQVALLKGSVVDIMMLRSAVNYDPFTESWSLSTQSCINDGSSKSGGERISASVLAHGSKETQRLFMTYAKFIKSLMAIIHGDLLVLSLLIMMSLFSADRAPLMEHGHIQSIQETYGRILEAYVFHRFQGEKNMFARMIMKLADLRDVNEVHSNMLLSMRMQDIEPLLLEVFDIPCSEDADDDGSSSSSPSIASTTYSPDSSSSLAANGFTVSPTPLSSHSSSISH